MRRPNLRLPREHLKLITLSPCQLTNQTLGQVFLKNKENFASLNSTLSGSWLFSLPQRLTSFRFLNSLGNARSNISAHYDLSDDMFKGVNPRIDLM
jgi:hypothetical protein